MTACGRPPEHKSDPKSTNRMPKGAKMDPKSGPFRVRCHPKYEKYQYPVRFWPKGGENMNFASIRG
jgi:hypothetical protein